MPVSVKLGGFARSHKAVHAALPKGFLVSVAVAVAFGFQLPQVVVDSLDIKDLSDAEGWAYVVVPVGAGIDVAVRTVSFCVNAKDEIE